MIELTNLPPAAALCDGPHKMLPRILHRQESGAPRAYLDSTALADAITIGEVVIDDLVLPWRPPTDDQQVDTILVDEPPRIESQAHRLLKVHARVVALANNPTALLVPEAPASDEPFPLRADLVAWDAFGVSETFECGVADGRSVLTQLHHGQVRVTVLPFAGLSLPVIRGYVFRWSGNPPLSSFDATDGEWAWSQLVAQTALQLNSNAPWAL